MYIDDSIVRKYINGSNPDEYKNDWIYDNVEEGINVFEVPDISLRDAINELLDSVINELNNFKPFNYKLFISLFPNWENSVESLNVKLIVGCKNPYDAFVRERDNKLIVYFDLIRINSYVNQGIEATSIIKQLLTHEIAHVCIHEKYSCKDKSDYIEQLKFIVFDEGFAHLLAFKDEISQYDFSTLTKKYYNDSVITLKEALNESLPEKQYEYLLNSNSGQYWNKFGAIAGKLYLANNLNVINKLYNDGVDNMINKILKLN